MHVLMYRHFRGKPYDKRNDVQTFGTGSSCLERHDRDHRHHHGGRPHGDARRGLMRDARAGQACASAPATGCWPRAKTAASAGRRRELTPRQQEEIVHLVDIGQKTDADAARLFNVHPSTIARLLAKAQPAP